ncbi:hypothetical protein Tco_0402120 [Tanacetum coccineum]
MFNMNERVYNQQLQFAFVSHQASVIHPQLYQVIHPQASQVIHPQSSPAPAISLHSSTDPLQFDSGLVLPYFLPTDDPLESFNKALAFIVDSGPCAYIMTNNAIFQSDGIDSFDSDCDEVSTAQAPFMSEHPNDTQTSVRVEVPKELPKCSVDKKLFEIEKKELKHENERLLEHIICQDVVNIVVHDDVKSVNVLPVQNTFLDDNITLDVMKIENDRLIELLVSQDLVHTVVNSLAVINDYKCMERSYIEEYERNLKLVVELS